jgi:hypothetical protein
LSDYPVGIALDTNARANRFAADNDSAVRHIADSDMQEKMIPDPLKPAYEKLVIRCSFGIINAGRNSA